MQFAIRTKPPKTAARKETTMKEKSKSSNKSQDNPETERKQTSGQKHAGSSGHHTNQGEGNRQADRQYREGVKKQLEHDDMEALAGDAKRALQDPIEGPELERARRVTKQGKGHVT
jgi:hypothetical protein